MTASDCCFEVFRSLGFLGVVIQMGSLGYMEFLYSKASIRYKKTFYKAPITVTTHLKNAKTLNPKPLTPKPLNPQTPKPLNP